MSLLAEQLQEKILVELQKHTRLLEQIATQNLALIEALADGDAGSEDEPPSAYLDGSPVHGGY